LALDAILGESSHTWPVKWGYLMMMPGVRGGAVRHAVETTGRENDWLLLLPLLWLGWEFVSATGSNLPEADWASIGSFFGLRGRSSIWGCSPCAGWRNPWPVWAGLAWDFAWRCGLP